MKEARHLLITGLVQGVGYRYAMVREAQRWGASGWVRNRSDGSVEAVIEGPPEVLAAMLNWARRGPAGAEVEHVAVELAEGGHHGFEQRPTA